MEILIAVAIVAGIGLLLGLGLAIASIVLAVPKDEKAEAIEEILPGADIRDAPDMLRHSPKGKPRQTFAPRAALKSCRQLLS